MLKKGGNPYYKQGAFTNALTFKPDVVTIIPGTNYTNRRTGGTRGTRTTAPTTTRKRRGSSSSWRASLESMCAGPVR